MGGIGYADVLHLNAKGSMELRDYLRILRKNWVLIVLVTLLGVGTAATYSLVSTPEYQASSTVFVSTQGGDTIADLQQGNSFTLQRVATYTSLVTTPIVLGPVVDELGLPTTAQKLAGRVSASSPLNTTLITVAVTDPSAKRAAAIANAVAASLTKVVDTIEKPSGATTSPVRLTQVQSATTPAAPTSPRVLLNLVLGALVGLALGIGAAVLRDVLDTRVRTPRDVEQLTPTPIIGAIAFDPKAHERPLIVHVDPLSPRAESFRTMRTNLQFLDLEGRASFVITSSLPGEGKSSTTVNLAIALADAGKRVALLDADLRKPRVAKYLGIEGGAGLTDVLIGRARVGDVMLPWGGRSLYVMPAGKIPPNPSELLGSEQMRTLLSVLERDFDVVLCDAPPLLPVTDAAILAKSTGGAIVTVSAGSTNKHQLAAALDSLQTVGAKVAGIVMNKVATKGPDAYYNYSYGDYLEDQPQLSASTARVRPLKPQARPHATRRSKRQAPAAPIHRRSEQQPAVTQSNLDEIFGPFGAAGRPPAPTQPLTSPPPAARQQ